MRGALQGSREGRGEPRQYPSPVQPLAQAGRLLLEKARSLRADILEELEDDFPSIGLAPTAHDPAVPPRRGPGIPTRVEQILFVGTEIPLPLEPAHCGRIERGQERGPRIDGVRRLEIV